ncbi:GntR family transcriptional regulator, transcriptional repressor for pyruvate dehydrogenase complex [Reichenbachiella agariperforans]|uniref:GntR family transcriptional regulator, transcriptional repressor for pyruvate dehydrogenase complex n=1 Tax=Reichenbachiella agariperforans TaxID=156994 RepID=A0A1M6RTM9_REIAG|nr:FadR/GntR family transcriptional regulator [Reichenbachiella agariperforans]SHK35637.1 GntR family transcriptional regulator, transcriptional repressor for pyruvate dehydrogenase complex [Reichenbachiella agariperforans]
MELLNNFKQIVIETPVDKIINQIKELITSGQLKPGDKLPPERKLCEALGVGRSHVRDAIKKLEFYGILKTLPQSGTVVAGLGMTALEGLITDVLRLEVKDFRSLVETRVILETNAAALAAQNRTEEDLAGIEAALLAYKNKKAASVYAVDEDLMFHLKIAEASKNSVLKSLMLVITPDILTNYNELDACGDGRSVSALEEHELILFHIKEKNIEGATQAMRAHLSDILDFSNTLQVEDFNRSNGKKR